MAAFEYQALTETGSPRSGIIEADSDKHARRQLREKDLTPLHVAESKKSAIGIGGSIRWRTTTLSGEQLALLTRLLSTLLRSGLPIDDALTALSKQSDSARLERVVLGVRSKVLEGRTLADSMGEFPEIFPDVYRATIGAGEQTQHLPLVLSRLAEHVEIRERMKKSVTLAMVYPSILITTAFLVVSGLLIFVVPEVVQVFDSLERELPTITRMLIAVSDFAQSYGLWCLLGMLVAVLAFKQSLSNKNFRGQFHAVLMRLPVVGVLLIDSDIGRYTRMLAIMLDSGVDMLDAMLISSKALYLSPLRMAIEGAHNAVREGSALNVALGEVEQIPSIVPHLAASGESAGNLVEMLNTAAQTLEQRVESALKLALSLLEPLLILVMGGIVLVIVIAILLPIFDMNQLV